MISRIWRFSVALVLTLAVGATSRAQAGVEQTQLQEVKYLAAAIFGDSTNDPDSPPPYDQLTSGTPNQKLLARVWYYGWALRHSPSSVADARTYMKDILDKQETWGHYSLNSNTDEVLTTSHFQLYAAGMAGAYLVALTNGADFSVTPRVSDSEILTKCRRWWLDENLLWKALANNGSAIDAPGARFPTDQIPPYTDSSYRDLIYGQLRGVRPKLPSGWDDKYYTGGWILEELYNRGYNPTQLVASISGYTPRVRLHDTLCIYRNGSEWLYYFPKLQVASDPVFWVQSRSGQPHDAGPVAGKPVYPPVKPANFSSVFYATEYRGLASGSISCPVSNAL